jgi:hypothetical protein
MVSLAIASSSLFSISFSTNLSRKFAVGNFIHRFAHDSLLSWDPEETSRVGHSVVEPPRYFLLTQ